MPVQLIGGSAGDAPFNRTFFNVALADLVEPTKDQAQKLTLYLVDGSTMDVCRIEEMADAYLALRAYRSGTEACDTTLHLIPYGTIYRIEISRHGTDDDASRLGFSWTDRRKANPPRRVK
ncbi:MAG TPA: hypothetical protein VMU54_10740 [Planctomycetota bacterium]|nr:hypothetical protein [Planctomycetota bacterium]